MKLMWGGPYPREGDRFRKRETISARVWEGPYPRRGHHIRKSGTMSKVAATYLLEDMVWGVRIHELVRIRCDIRSDEFLLVRLRWYKILDR